MKAKILAVAVAGMLVGCGSGGGLIEFQSQKGEPEVLVVDEFQHHDALIPTVNEVPEADLSPYAQDGDVAVNEVTEGGIDKGPSLVQEENPEFHQENGDPAFNEVEELAICQREGLRDQETCQAALNLIETGISEAKGEFDKNPQAFQVQSKAIVGTAENGIKRSTKRDATYPEVIEFLVNSTLEEDTFENRYAAAGYAIATYYYVRGIPEGHTKTGNPGLCADKGYCGDQYLKYQWN